MLIRSTQGVDLINNRVDKEPWQGWGVAARSGDFGRRALVLVVFAVAMAYLESACVVYLQRALGITPARLFPMRAASSLGGFAAIEVGREFATLVMLWATGWMLGTSWLTRLAWTSVAFGVWDIAYYGWLDAFIGWPGSLGTWDLLFLIPAPWAGPVWSPVAVSLALIGFGLAIVRRDALGQALRMSARALACLLAGGAIVIWAFLWNARVILAFGVPTSFPWPLFAGGMLIGILAATRALRTR